MVRRLPVLQSQDSEDAQAAARPPWHWIVIGTTLAFTMWLPLAVVGLWIGRALSGTVVDDTAAADAVTPGQRFAYAAALIVPVLVSYVVACGISGALVGRFGGRAGAREAAWGAAAAGPVATLLGTLGGGGVGSWAVTLATGAILALVGAGAGLIGGRIGHKRRPRI